MSSGGLSVALGSGTTTSHRIDLDRRQTFAFAAGLLLVLWGYLSQFLPSLPDGINSVVSTCIALTLVGAIVYGLAPLDRHGHGLLLVAAVVLPFTMLMIAFEAVAPSNVLKVILAAIVGLWIAQGMTGRGWIIAFAAAASLSDVVSVLVGPTRMMLNHSPEMIGGFTIAMTWFGYSGDQLHTAIGVADIVFISMFLGAARRFGLRELPSLVAMLASIIVTLLAALWWHTLPALPLISLYFIGVNIDLIVGRETASGGAWDGTTVAAGAGSMLQPTPSLAEAPAEKTVS